MGWLSPCRASSWASSRRRATSSERRRSCRIAYRVEYGGIEMVAVGESGPGLGTSKYVVFDKSNVKVDSAGETAPPVSVGDSVSLWLGASNRCEESQGFLKLVNSSSQRA